MAVKVYSIFCNPLYKFLTSITLIGVITPPTFLPEKYVRAFLKEFLLTSESASTIAINSPLATLIPLFTAEAFPIPLCLLLINLMCPSGRVVPALRFGQGLRYHSHSSHRIFFDCWL